MEDKEEFPSYFKKSPEIAREMMRPDLADKIDDFGLFTKELKTSNIKRGDIEEMEDMTDLAWFFKRVCGGKSEFADFIIAKRDARLSLTSSVDGFQTLTQQTQIQELRLKEDKRGLASVFKRTKEEGKK